MKTAEQILREVFTENFQDSEDGIIKAMKIYANEKLKVAIENSWSISQGVFNDETSDFETIEVEVINKDIIESLIDEL